MAQISLLPTRGEDRSGELWSEFAGCRRGRRTVIHAADNGGRSRIANVIEPCRHGKVGTRDREIPKGQKLRGDGRAAPGSPVQFAGNAGHLRRVETLACQVDNTAEVEVATHYIGKQG